MDISLHGISMSGSHSTAWAFVEISQYHPSIWQTSINILTILKNIYIYSRLVEQSNFPTNLFQTESVFVSSSLNCDLIVWTTVHIHASWHRRQGQGHEILHCSSWGYLTAKLQFRIIDRQDCSIKCSAVTM